MSKNAQKAKSYYDRGLWTKQMLANLVAKGFITQAEFDEIVGAD